MKSRRSWWLVYGACAAAVMLALVWVTVTVVRLERSEIQARTDTTYQEALRLALWRMDSWLAPQLAQEAARPYFDYQPFYSHARAYTALLSPIRPGEVLTPSPLLSFASDYFSLHFQMGPDGRLTSPQAPIGQYRVLAEDAYLSDEQIASNAAVLITFGETVTPQQVAECAALGDTPPLPSPPIPLAAAGQSSPLSRADDTLSQQVKSRQELTKRRGAYRQAIEQQQAANVVAADTSVVVGSFVPFWNSGPDGADELIFSRSVLVGDKQYYQGFLCDWRKLRGALMDQIADLFETAMLVPVAGAAAAVDSGTLLATIPVALQAPAPVGAAAGLMSPARATLALTWFAVLAGMVAVAVTLRASIAFGHKRARFASAVTHELRTPLTTFRMYSEMLADGMVTDDEQRRVYLDTLKSESRRLSNLVENVLAYARLEEGRRPSRTSPTTWAALLDEVVPQLRQRIDAAGMELNVADGTDDTPLTVDVEAVGQILFNLVDNACKYAPDGTVTLSGHVNDGTLTLTVRDHGPGIPAPLARAVFDPFERGARHDGDGTPGVGLGLALARGLARDLGGDLEIDSTVRDGACFTLTLPT